jgi:hypothetical protein
MSVGWMLWVNGGKAVAAMLAATTLLGLPTLVQAADAVPAGCELKGDSRHLRSPRLDVVFRPTPSPILVGKDFVLDIIVCPHKGVTAPTSLRVDATLPEHRHGMNYKPNVWTLQSNPPIARYRAEGMMFHRAGRWELHFEVRAGGQTARFTHPITVK